jgi:2-keto-4-pentenoate hydratase/2-oxohepta-3-ene-1,7-dioic acid hydratase in catechol pathway
VKWVRVDHGGRAAWGVVDGDHVRLHDDAPWSDGFRADAPRAVVPRAGLSLLTPVAPTKIVCVARNYRAHAAELGNEVPAEPLFFLKPPSSLLAPGGTVRRPPGVGRVEYEGELGVVVGRRMSAVAEADALAHVFGYVPLVDVTARQLQKALGHFTQAKGYDTFCPVGPVVETALDAADVRLVTRKNGAVVQDGRTSMMVHGLAKLLAFISHAMTLEPGDLVATGTPEGVGPLEAGDRLEVAIDGLEPLEIHVA